MSDVLFGQGYYLRFDPKLWHARQPYPPLGTLYAAAHVRRLGWSVALFDAMLAQSEEGWRAQLLKTRPRFAVLYEDSFNYLSKMCLSRMREASLRMVGMAKAQGCEVFVAGSDSTDHPEPYLAAGASAVIAGEGEITLGEVLRARSEGSGLEGMPGVVCVGSDGVLRRGPTRAFVNDLDALPLPAWDLVDVEAYRRIWKRRHGRYSMNLVTTRGCPYHCNWCAKPIYGQRYAVRSVDAVVAEMRWLDERFAPDHFSFVDDIFGLQPGWIERFAKALEGTRRVPFKCLSRADLLDDATVKALRRAGCEMVWIGAESGSQKILDAMEKGVRVEQIESAAAALRRAGMAVGLFLQFGYPGETREDIERTLQMVRRVAPDDIGMSVSYPLPGTKFHDRVRSQMAGKENWVDSGDLAMLFDAPARTEYFRALHTALHREFRMRRARRLLAETPWSLRHAATLGFNALALRPARRRLERLDARSSGDRVPAAGAH